MTISRNISVMAQGASSSGILAGGYGGLGASISPTTAGNTVFTTDGTNWSSTQKIVRGTSVASTSGTSIDFTSIPSWVKRITILMNGVSLTSTAHFLFQIGTGGTPTTTGYVGATSAIGGSTTAFVTSSTSGIPSYQGSAATSFYGSMSFFNVSSNNWVASGCGAYNGGGSATAGGNVSLAGTLDMVRITNTATGTNSFDAGTINIFYE